MAELNINLPEGWETTGEYRPPEKGEFYLGKGDRVTRAFRDLEFSFPVLRRELPAVITVEIKTDVAQALLGSSLNKDGSVTEAIITLRGIVRKELEALS